MASPTTLPDDTLLPDQTGAGTLLAYKTTANGTAISIGTIESLDGPSISVGEVESTRLASNFKPYAPTIPEGEASFTVQHRGGDPGVAALRAMMAKAPVPVVFWVVTYPDGYTDTFPGFGKGYKVQSVENESIITATVDIRLTGPVVIAQPTAPSN